MAQRIYSTKDVADILCVEPWRVRRVFEAGDVQDPGRFGGRRTIPGELIPSIVDALRERGWLPAEVEAAK